MNKLILPLTCLALLFTPIARGDELPFFSSLREEVTNQLTIASNTLPLNKRLLAVLRSNLKLIDRTRTNWVSGSTALGILARSLGKTTLSNTFLPILVDTRAVYLDDMGTATSALEDRLAATMPGTARNIAQKSLGKLSAALEGATTNLNFTLSLRSLSRAATVLSLAHKQVARAETARPGASFLTATIIESNQGTNLFKPSKRTALERIYAFYEPANGDFDIETGTLQSLGGRRVQFRSLTLGANLPGSGTYTFDLAAGDETIAWYQRIVAPSLREFESDEPEFEFYEFYPTVDPIHATLGTGTLNIRFKLEAKVAWGDFTFTATGTENPNLQVTMTGSFLVRVELLDDGYFEE